MKNTDDEADAPPQSDDNNCVSGLIGSVLTLIISILVWVQKIGCKNISSLTDCPDTCELLPTLEKLSLFAKQAEAIEANGSAGKSCSCSKHGKKDKKEKSDKNLKKSKSGDNHAVLYAVSQDNLESECKKCCKKVVEPKEKKENDNVIFEVVAAQMAENETQTDEKSFSDQASQCDAPEVVEKEAETIMIDCACSTTQVSPKDFTKVETQDVGVQVEIETKRSVRMDDTETQRSAKVDEFVDPYACPEPRFEACMNDDDDDEEEDYDEEEEEDEPDLDQEPEVYITCPPRCITYAQTRPNTNYRRPTPYPRGQPSMRQDRPSFYAEYESPPLYNQYNSGYDPYGPMRYPYQPQSPHQAQPQPYYQRGPPVQRMLVQRGPPAPRKIDYQNQLQRQISPTQRPKLDTQSGVEKYSQSEPAPAPPSPAEPIQSKRESTNQRDQSNAKGKECMPQCPASKPVTVRKLSATPVPSPQTTPPPQSPPHSQKPHTPQPAAKKECDPKCPKSPKPVVTEKGEVTRTPSKKCVSKCANPHKSQSKTNSQDSKQKPRPLSFMPKGAIPVEPRDVLEVEEAPPQSKQTILPDSVMSVETTKRSK